MKLSRTVGLAVAVSLVAGPWRRSRRSAERFQPARPRMWWMPEGICACRQTTEPSTKRSGAGRLPPTAARAEGNPLRLRLPGGDRRLPEDGDFPDGAVLVKEVFATSTNEMTTGTVSHADELKGWFVMVRDSKGTHPGNPLWGDGWGWSWFDADKPLKTTSTDYRSDCQGCHVPPRPPTGFT